MIVAQKKLINAPVSARSNPEWFENLPDKLTTAVKDYNLPNTGDWSVLDELSSATQFEDIEVYGDDAVFEDGNFIAPATVYVQLVYAPNSEDPAVINDSYPARVHFQIERVGKNRKRVLKVERIEVDTSSFYE